MKHKDDDAGKKSNLDDNKEEKDQLRSWDYPEPKTGLRVPNPNDFKEGYERCFPAGTLIQMADGSGRPISVIRINDRISCWDRERRSVVSGRVTDVIEASVDDLVQINGHLAASPSHRILTSEGYLRFDEIRVGAQVFRLPKMTLEPVYSMEILSGPVQVFNLRIEPFACFFAEGFLVEDHVGNESEHRVNGAEPGGLNVQSSLELQLPSGISPT